MPGRVVCASVPPGRRTLSYGVGSACCPFHFVGHCEGLLRRDGRRYRSCAFCSTTGYCPPWGSDGHAHIPHPPHETFQRHRHHTLLQHTRRNDKSPARKSSILRGRLKLLSCLFRQRCQSHPAHQPRKHRGITVRAFPFRQAHVPAHRQTLYRQHPLYLPDQCATAETNPD